MNKLLMLGPYQRTDGDTLVRCGDVLAVYRLRNCCILLRKKVTIEIQSILAQCTVVNMGRSGFNVGVVTKFEFNVPYILAYKLTVFG